MKLTSTLCVGLLAVATGAGLGSASAATYSTDFNAGTDAGWTHYPGINIGLANSWTFPASSQGGLGYKLVSNAGTGTNPGRVGSVYTAISTADFYVQADLIDWNSTWGQYMGLAARFTSGGPINFPTAYALVLRNDQVGPGPQSALQITKLDNISGSTVLSGNQGFFNVSGSSPAPAPAGDYQMQFWGMGNNLYGRIIDLSTGLPMLFNDGSGGLASVVSTFDSTYASGQTGLMGFIRTSQGVDPTFDNFLVTTVIPEPATATLAGLGLAALLVYRRRK
jgi:hypothetical protein